MNAAVANTEVNPVFIHTGQHYDYEMSQSFLEELKLPKMDYFLNVQSGTHSNQTANLLTTIERTLLLEKPDVVLVLGDTNTTLAGALSAAKLRIPIAHVEAGCRSFDYDMPEEINRLAVDAISSIYYAPSEVAALNLLSEGKPKNRVFLAGNTIVDIVHETQEIRSAIRFDSEIGEAAPVLVTLHRQENVDDKTRLSELLRALSEIKEKVVFPIHPRTKKRIEEFKLTEFVDNIPNLRLVKPQKYLTFMKLLEKAKVVITDSGGVQEEAIIVGTPCVTARDTTEWPETVWAGGNHLAGRSAPRIAELCNQLLEDAEDPTQTTKWRNPFQGNAGPTIIQTLVTLWKDEELWPQKLDMSQGKYPLPWLVEVDADLEGEFLTNVEFDKEGRGVIGNKQQAVRRIIRWSKAENRVRNH